MQTWKDEAVTRVCSSFVCSKSVRQIILFQRVFRKKLRTWDSATGTTKFMRGLG
jgi:hypothetical protein